MGDLFLGVDVGSSAVKVVVTGGLSEQVIHLVRQEYERLVPAPGRTEIVPGTLVAAVVTALGALPEDVKSAVAGIGFTGQMCSVLCLDGRAEPIGNFISIFDTRATEQIAMLEREHGEHLHAHEANRAFTIHTLPKLLWLRKHHEEGFDRVRRVMLAKDYVRGVLTGVWITDPSDASGTLAFDQRAGRWDRALTDALGMRADLWPDVMPSTAPAGSLTPEAAAATGLRVGLPVIAGAADMAAVPIGVGAVTPDRLIVSLGTAAHVIGPVDELMPDAWPVQQYTQAVPDGWYRFGAVFSGGLALDWFCQVTGRGWGDHPFGAAVWKQPAQRVLFMPYLAGAGTPHYLPEVGGSFVGLRAGHGPADLAQAVLEGVAFEVAQVCQSLDPRSRRTSVHVTGGACRIKSFVEVLAGVLEREVIVARSPEAAGVGAAVLARAGLRAEPASVGRNVPERCVVPSDEAVAFYRELAPRYRTTARAIRDCQ